jgi:hypothetical protein
MMNKSLRARSPESSRKMFYGFQRRDVEAKTRWRKKEPPFPAALKLITGRRQTEWTGATRCPNEDNASHNRESLIDRKRAIFFRDYLPCRPLAEFSR